MRYFISPGRIPLVYESSGEVFKSRNFIHQRRRIDTFIIIICVEGVLHIAQDSYQHSLRAGDYLVLFAGHEHYGFKYSEEPVTYYWCHFSVTDNAYRIAESGEAAETFNREKIGGGEGNYILPEQDTLPDSARAFLIFRQILDISRRSAFSKLYANYALSMLAMEITEESRQAYADSRDSANHNMEKLVEWVRINYNRRLSLLWIARQFSYNPDYLSTAFRKYTGIPLMKYITTVRIEAAKKELLNTQSSIKEIAFRTGFSDEKNFIKRFKQFEGITASQYRNTFSKAKLVRGNTKKDAPG
ncbi:MAG: AraC family transcriptional regulator [Treponema sp.]|nr:AraC family transcriptional regulator [Treponema sp.]